MFFEDLIQQYDQWLEIKDKQQRFAGVKVDKQDMDDISTIVERARKCNTRKERFELLESIRKVRYSKQTCDICAKYGLYLEPFHVSRHAGV